MIVKVWRALFRKSSLVPAPWSSLWPLFEPRPGEELRPLQGEEPRWRRSSRLLYSPAATRWHQTEVGPRNKGSLSFVYGLRNEGHKPKYYKKSMELCLRIKAVGTKIIVVMSCQNLNINVVHISIGNVTSYRWGTSSWEWQFKIT